MNYLKKTAEVVATIMIFVGFFLLVGTAGASDYADEIGEVFSYSKYIPYIVSGFVLIFSGLGIVKYLESKGWYEDGSEEC